MQLDENYWSEDAMQMFYDINRRLCRDIVRMGQVK